jgi:glycosyltransferase involved in cell wall biosynthesis
MDLSIITPSFNMLTYLKRACASVADQEGVSHEHIVVDACSTDGTPEWLRGQITLQSIVEKDNGMYDAINKGLRKAKGEILGYINCDEQYLPGTLSAVRSHFDRCPDTDVLFGSTLITYPDGSLATFRKSYPTIEPFVLSSHLYSFTCSMFFRRRIIDRGDQFDARYRLVGDLEFVVRLLRRGYRFRHTTKYLSAFTLTGSNMGFSADGTFARTSREGQMIESWRPWWVRRFQRPLDGVRVAVKLLSGAYFQGGPIIYAVYGTEDATRRSWFRVERAPRRWPVYQPRSSLPA